jgi:hypothetical protein
MALPAEVSASPSQRKWLPLLLAVVLGVPWVLLTQRFASFILLVPAFLLLWHLHRHGRKALTVSVWVLIAVAPLLPVDVYPTNVPGSPRWVPLMMGYPSPEGLEAASRGEIVLGGCIINGFEPRWVWVW